MVESGNLERCSRLPAAGAAPAARERWLEVEATAKLLALLLSRTFVAWEVMVGACELV